VGAGFWKAFTVTKTAIVAEGLINNADALAVERQILDELISLTVDQSKIYTNIPEETNSEKMQKQDTEDTVIEDSVEKKRKNIDEDDENEQKLIKTEQSSIIINKISIVDVMTQTEETYITKIEKKNVGEMNEENKKKLKKTWKMIHDERCISTDFTVVDVKKFLDNIGCFDYEQLAFLDEEDFANFKKFFKKVCQKSFFSYLKIN
jgi:hypothetical protein